MIFLYNLTHSKEAFDYNSINGDISIMRCCFICFQKNEHRLLPYWIDYHAELSSYSSLYVFDNGSDKSMEPILDSAEKLGVNIIRDYNSKEHFESKGRIIAKYILDLRQLNLYDFFFPLDCDEFVAASIDNEKKIISTSKSDLIESLSSLLDVSCPIKIAYSGENDPHIAQLFHLKGRRKLFVSAKAEISSMSCGYHSMRTATQKKLPDRLNYGFDKK